MIDPSILIVAIAVLGLLAAASVRRIPEGQVYSLRRIGRPSPRLLMPGVHWIWPLAERIAHKISLGGHTLGVDGPDGQHAHIYWQVLDPVQAAAIIGDAERLIGTELHTMWTHTPSETQPQRGHHFKHMLNAQLRPRGLLVTRVDLGSR
ncbi:hypothetical protein [Oleiagrimonas sp. C23AA]|uniref:hypothetical protein n=1 Tax=Oleiagrimonas sp. C23AA TaxID=2719047 RepID=UPI0014210411|nr:hypothetical protein [Oleiagrimonas sp. C23AA]NII11346.1 hypothetical protein [Oleiagrimonas sp. C23AA]